MVFVNFWSGPRCCSTALLYSFGSRTDTLVYDEPLYASFLERSGYERPYRSQVLASQSSDGEAVMQGMVDASFGKHVYAKQMGKFVTCIQRKWLQEGAHVVLVRDPMAVVNSFSEVLDATLEETCLPSLCSIVSELRRLGKKPIVVLSEDLVNKPEATLRSLCAAIGMPWDSAMLRWPAGPKPYDGVWAPWWYKTAHASTGWQRPSNAEKPIQSIPESLKPLLHECYTMYSLLLPYVLIPEALPMRTSSGILPLASFHSQASDSVYVSKWDSFSSPTSPRQGGEEGGDSDAEKTGTHVYEEDPRNADIIVGIRDGVSGNFKLVWRPAAKVSVFDSGFILGDGVWEGIRLHKGVLTFAREHLARLYQGAKAIDMDLGISPLQLQALIYKAVDATGMRHACGVHIRVMVTRGLKPTPYQNPTCTIGAPTIVIIPEWKEASATPKEQGIKLSTVHVRRGAPDVQDQALNSHSKLNCITACIAANKAGADEGLMLDPHGFVATCNSVNFFIVVKTWQTIRTESSQSAAVYEVWAPTTKYQLHGITRANVLSLCDANGIKFREKDFSLTSVYSAEEAFVTGTFAGLIPVTEVDGRMIGDGKRGHICFELQQLYAAAMDDQSEQGRLCSLEE